MEKKADPLQDSTVTYRAMEHSHSKKTEGLPEEEAEQEILAKSPTFKIHIILLLIAAHITKFKACIYILGTSKSTYKPS